MMQVLVDAEVVAVPGGKAHLKLRLGGVAYTPEDCNLDDTDAEQVEGDRPADICEREKAAFAALDLPGDQSPEP